MTDTHRLQRFIDAQDWVFQTALAELRAGHKQSHWMWFVFPQLADLGRSPTAKFYGIASLDEARAYLAHSMLGPRLEQSVDTIMIWASERSADQILGAVDSMKLRSSLTLFDRVAPDGIFARALDSFFDGKADKSTLAVLDRNG